MAVRGRKRTMINDGHNTHKPTYESHDPNEFEELSGEPLMTRAMILGNSGNFLEEPLKH